MLFHPNDPPITIIKKIVQHKALPGEFPTRKNPAGYIRSSSPLMRDALVHLDTDPTIHEIAASPNRITFPTSPFVYERAKMKDHVPALRGKTQHGRYIFWDVIPIAVQASMKGLAKRTARLKEHLQADYGAGYCVLDEGSLHIQPRHRNLRIMWKVGRHTDDYAVAAVLEALREEQLPLTIGDLRSRVKLSAPRWTVFDDDGVVLAEAALADVDRVFAAVMRLAMDGILAPDLSKPFSDDTLLHWFATSAKRIFV